MGSISGVSRESWEVKEQGEDEGDCFKQVPAESYDAILMVGDFVSFGIKFVGFTSVGTLVSLLMLELFVVSESCGRNSSKRPIDFVRLRAKLDW